MRDASGPGGPAAVRPRRAARQAEPPPLKVDWALFLDIDGTLLELAPTPKHVRVDDGVASLLPRLAAALGGAVALITGRALADAERLFPGVSLPIAGQHGLERRAADGSLHMHDLHLGELQALRHELAIFAARYEGLLLEDKGATLALHYRVAPGLASHVHRSLKAKLASSPMAGGLRLQRGKGVLEITPDGRDKGTAILEYMAERPFAGRLPVFVGDDRTDEYGFEAVIRAGGLAVKVGRGSTRAPFRLADVAAVRKWLGAPIVTERFHAQTPKDA